MNAVDGLGWFLLAGDGAMFAYLAWDCVQTIRRRRKWRAMMFESLAAQATVTHEHWSLARAEALKRMRHEKRTTIMAMSEAIAAEARRRGCGIYEEAPHGPTGQTERAGTAAPEAAAADRA